MLRINEQEPQRHMFKQDWTPSSSIINCSTLDDATLGKIEKILWI